MYKHDKKMKVYIKSKAEGKQFKHAYNNVVVICFIFKLSKQVIQKWSSSFSSTLLGLKYFEMNNMYIGVYMQQRTEDTYFKQNEDF